PVGRVLGLPRDRGEPGGERQLHRRRFRRRPVPRHPVPPPPPRMTRREPHSTHPDRRDSRPAFTGKRVEFGGDPASTQAEAMSSRHLNRLIHSDRRTNKERGWQPPPPACSWRSTASSTQP